MKKILFVFILICTIIVSTSCTIAPNCPVDGIWYNEELKLAFEFKKNKDLVYSYDENFSDLDLKIRWWRDGGVEIGYEDESGDFVELYSGWRIYKNKNKFIIKFNEMANPEDDFKTKIDLDDKKYVFVRIESYNEIEKMENTSIA